MNPPIDYTKFVAFCKFISWCSETGKDMDPVVAFWNRNNEDVNRTYDMLLLFAEYQKTLTPAQTPV